MEGLISFVIPCYRSEYTIKGVTDEIIATMNLRMEYDYEIICVNDCSPDSVIYTLREMAAKNKQIKVINFTRNFSKENALMAGLRKSRGEFVVILDDDGQCPVDKTWKLIDALKDEAENYDVAMAKYEEKKESAFKRFGSLVNRKMSERLIDQPKGLYFENFLAMKESVVKQIVTYTNPYPCLQPLMVQATQSFVNIEMEERERADDKRSGFTFIKSFRQMMDCFTNFSVKPLRIASFMGGLTSAAGFIFGIVIIVAKIVMKDEMDAGYASIMAILLFIGGMIMMMLGAIGEYVGRMYISINNAPQYVIKEEINFDEN
ncbi:MAG: glycosyltransferase [Pseudobutyrivibrio sp.]|nr:glycosyltransferase [Pseudobutyrivibrio sp.]